MATVEQRVEQALSLLQGLNLTPLELLTQLTENPNLQRYRGSELKAILETRWQLRYSNLDEEILVERFRSSIASEIIALTGSNNFHFNISKLTEQNLQTIEISSMARQMKLIAPNLWSLLELLLSANNRLVLDRERKRKQATNLNPRSALKRTGSTTTNFSFDGELEIPVVPPDNTPPNHIPSANVAGEAQSVAEERSQALIEVVSAFHGTPKESNLQAYHCRKRWYASAS